ncbi:alpha/beta hydrolase fold domain-containing protein [Herbiconiux liukaitaii]|uniref:alpha/beta hydrolase fold domain-containing protein n=1 Tax=Herbiconiux liukaitaii TaxID=3342799 RepID=UPI0035B83B94
MSVVVERDIVYATEGGVELGLDLYRPDMEGPVPVVVFVHGGAWRKGDKALGSDTRFPRFAGHGIAVASINYRLLDQALFPAALHDVKGAIRWLRAHGAELGLATERIGLWGATSGAHLASLAALTQNDPEWEGTTGGPPETSSAVQAVVHWFGPVDLVNGAHRSWLEEILLEPPIEPPLFGAETIDGVVDLARTASPLFRVSADAPPFLISHGDRDRVLPRSESEAFHDALSRAGAQSSLLIVAGAGHEDHAFDSPANLALVAAFFTAHLTPALPPSS